MNSKKFKMNYLCPNLCRIKHTACFLLSYHCPVPMEDNPACARAHVYLWSVAMLLRQRVCGGGPGASVAKVPQCRCGAVGVPGRAGPLGCRPKSQGHQKPLLLPPAPFLHRECDPSTWTYEACVAAAPRQVACRLWFRHLLLKLPLKLHRPPR
ncbi:hypothetical protein E2C01_023868 [Portunus trituberculatus]|uniref:Uncharacterized protein n=1 Tax=Portunus trituberculatus TaxID=210409 RepID=A0A5B7E931_PORTR|nr:hypothetical protein [Portunus trituberculatus]